MKKLNIQYPHVLIGASSVGLVASFWQAAERVHMLKNPTEALSCNLSPIVDCTGVLERSEAAIFGPPNALIGIVTFSILLGLGIQRLAGGTWTQPSQYVAVALSKIIALFSLWFFWVSLYSIGKVCIFCMFIWAASMPLAIYGVKDYYDTVKKPPKLVFVKGGFVQKHHFSILIFIYAAMITLYFLRFQDYYFG